MCFACDRLGIRDEYPLEDRKEEEEEEEPEPQGPTLPPRRQLASKSPPEVTVVRPAPSHDGSPIFAAWSVLEASLLGGGDPGAADDQRPPFGLVIYDTAPGACAARAERMARLVFDRTVRERRRPDGDPDRVEVVALATIPRAPPREVAHEQPGTTAPTGSEPADDLLTPLDRAEACIRHFEAERASRLAIADAAAAKSWFLPERIYDDWYAWGIIVVDRLEEGEGRWEEALGYLEDHPEEGPRVVLDEAADARASRFGSFLSVRWGPREEVWESGGKPVRPGSRVHLNPARLESIGRVLGSDVWENVGGFYNHFLPDGILDRELEAARGGM